MFVPGEAVIIVVKSDGFGEPQWTSLGSLGYILVMVIFLNMTSEQLLEAQITLTLYEMLQGLQVGYGTSMGSEK